MDLELTPLLKGLSLGKVRLLLYEKREFRTTTGKRHTVAAVVEVNTMEIPPEAFVPGELETDDKYVFQATLQLPQSLKKCRQDVESDPITIEHELKVNVQLHNPDGHVSEVRIQWIPLSRPSIDELQATNKVRRQTNNITKSHYQRKPGGFADTERRPCRSVRSAALV